MTERKTSVAFSGVVT